MSRATGSLCQPLPKIIDVSIQANSIFSQNIVLKLGATSSNMLDYVTYVKVKQ